MRYYETNFIDVVSFDRPVKPEPSGWIPVIDQFWDFAINFENFNLTITNEMSFESKIRIRFISFQYMPVILHRWEI